MGRSDLPDAAVFSLPSDQDAARRDASRLFARVEAELRALLPASSDIRHIGATAVSGCLTKGDLDVVVRVEGVTFAESDRVLSERFARNAGSKRTDSFSAFEDGEAVPHLGVQLTVKGGPDDYFHSLTDALNRDPALVDAYNALKRRFVGQPMESYRDAKSAFIRDVLARQDD
ncbi:MAG TPA: GrpB family protein [Hyphomicrobium sp.]|nr:GrpB family protein [Hyphomicrobium sp.]HRO50187.1 GrpB family protein [Hyphomicrobium sp.]